MHKDGKKAPGEPSRRVSLYPNSREDLRCIGFGRVGLAGRVDLAFRDYVCHGCSKGGHGACEGRENAQDVMICRRCRGAINEMFYRDPELPIRGGVVSGE